MRHKYRLTMFAFLFCTAAVISPAQAVDNNLSFNGTLVSEPCDLDPATTDITVDFGTVIEKYLYLNTRTNSKPFVINLINCDISLGNQVAITFKGTESAALPGLLAITGSAKGAAIGMEMPDGTPLPINQPTPPLTLNSGTSSYAFQAYVEGEPDEIKNQSIVPGVFSAIATFEMNYN
ncbi:MAG: fimbrial protein [Silvania sp.]